MSANERSRRAASAQFREVMIARLRDAGLRPTHQRIELAELLFRNGHRHLTAEMLHAEACAEGIRVSLATIYNTLHQFTLAGLLLQVVVDSTRKYFDTNTVPHQHFYCEDDDMLIDILGPEITVAGLPTTPPGTQVERVDVVVHLRRPQPYPISTLAGDKMKPRRL